MASDSNASASPLTIGQLIAGMGLFGSATPLSKIIGEHYPVFTASCLRMVIASIVLAPFVLALTSRYRDTARSDWGVIAAIAAFGMVGFTATMLFGMRLTTGVIGSTIMSASPAITAAAAVVFFGAAMNWRKGGALALAVVGVVVVNVFRGGGGGGSGGAGDAALLGGLLVLVAVCFEAAYTLLSRKLSDGITSLEATLAASLLAAPLFVALAFAFDPAPFDFSRGTERSLYALLFWGAGTGGLAPVLWYNGVRKAPGALTAGAMSVMPLTALGLSYVLLGEAFRWVHLAGFGLVFAGLVLMIREHAADAQDG
ncbi:DMT family transporter [Erythrobacter sp. HL-111]|uniref:DMT family transporter n=1 Tax=Erythrobacter sp. HL-111 TaxID=1798193 RepID=UPI0006DA4D33|nr:DMT family transporter [Erythrobacter sp. HL-111]KPP92946.1 MAG: Permeases of the drug/metabolite transporter (DMT) superfamily [Erythrobacteraceae bacterium HL-111]SDT03069.1 Permease of the drug/metabolite transporter (DMT) superfamily [Erythrobacter sp. HL-111]